VLHLNHAACSCGAEWGAPELSRAVRRKFLSSRLGKSASGDDCRPVGLPKRFAHLGMLAWNGTPLAVRWRVIAVLLSAHKHEIRRGLETHVPQKGRKTAPPSLADFDARTTIPGVSVIRRSVTSRYC
jgi:hypothetical protein